MLGKLMKYEFKATGRKFLPLYVAILVVSLLLNLGIRFPEMELMLVLSGMVLFTLFVALVVMTLMTIINRFKNNLLSDEGYLMFTLPVSTEKLILSKLIVAMVWILSSGILSILSALLILANGQFIDAATQALNRIPELFYLIKGEYITWTILGIVCFFTQLIYFILLIYTSLSVSQMAVFHKHRGFISFAAFMILYVVVNVLIGMLFKNTIGITNFYNNMEAITPVLSMAIGTNVVLSLIMFSGTYYLLKHHLNIE